MTDRQLIIHLAIRLHTEDPSHNKNTDSYDCTEADCKIVREHLKTEEEKHAK